MLKVPTDSDLSDASFVTALRAETKIPAVYGAGKNSLAASVHIIRVDRLVDETECAKIALALRESLNYDGLAVVHVDIKLYLYADQVNLEITVRLQRKAAQP